jgi:hypothetical protein
LRVSAGALKGPGSADEISECGGANTQFDTQLHPMAPTSDRIGLRNRVLLGVIGYEIR